MSCKATLSCWRRKPVGRCHQPTQPTGVAYMQWWKQCQSRRLQPNPGLLSHAAALIGSLVQFATKGYVVLRVVHCVCSICGWKYHCFYRLHLYIQQRLLRWIVLCWLCSWLYNNNLTKICNLTNKQPMEDSSIMLSVSLADTFVEALLMACYNKDLLQKQIKNLY